MYFEIRRVRLFRFFLYLYPFNPLPIHNNNMSTNVDNASCLT